MLERQLKRAGLSLTAPPADLAGWSSLLEAVDRAYAQADDDRYLLERSLALSSEEMGELHAQLAAERDTISTAICSLAEGICAVDRDGAILLINPKAARLLRLEGRDRLIGRRLCDLAQARTADGRDLASMLGDATPEPAPQHTDETRLIIDGDDSAFITASVCALGPARDGWVIALRDITAGKRLESEREDLTRKLLEASRSAGMAEVASEVLHNVGNVLNSVNVSATLAGEAVRASKAAAVSKLARLLAENRDRLAEFLTSDPAGAQVPEYLAKLGARLEEEQARLAEELSQLRRNIDHIRGIIATQQSHARGAMLKQSEQVPDLIEEALHITGASLARHQVEVMRDFQPVPPVLIERHHALQILVNLITNAKQAVASRQPGERRIVVRLRGGAGRVAVCIEDNGMGIAPENLTRVFQHGFTTRSDGHGFGLHSAALAARAMGGAITARSDGPGRGAAFTVEIPLEVTEARAA